MAAPILQIKRGNAGAGGTVTALRPGEPAISLNNFDFFIGIDTSVANNKFFGSHRYWGREDGTSSLRIKLVDKGGVNSINLKSPDTLTGTGGTYTLPDTSTIQAGYFLKVAADGTLSWDTVTSAASFSNSTLTGITTINGGLLNNASTVNSGITTFTNTTDNTLGNSNTGAVQIDGGVGIDKNLTVGGNLNVQGYSEFVGVVTFRGGTINIGDGTTDNINVTGEFISNLVPDVTNTYSIGISTQQWKDAFFAGIGSFSNLRVVNNLYDSSNSTGSSGQFLTMTGSGIGWTTVSGVTGGTISTATRATLVDTTTAPSGTFYPGLFVNSTGTASTAVYVDSGISYVSNTDTLTISGNIAVNGGTLTSNSGVTTVFNTGVTTTNVFGAATTINLGANTGTLTIGNPTVVGTQASQTLYDTVATTLNFGRAATSFNIGANTGTLTIGNPTVVGTQATQNLYNTVATNLNFGGAATALVMGATTGIATINNPTVVGSQATQNLYNTVATTLNFGGAATALNMGATTGTATINNPTVVGSQATQNLYNTVATNLNFGGAATALNMGASTGIATINNITLTLPNATTVNVNGANPTLASSSTGTLTLFNANLTKVNAFQAATDISIGAATGITTVRNSLRVTNNLYDSTNSAGSSGQFLVVTGAGIGWTTISGVAAGTISTATRANTVDTTTTTANQNYFIPFVTNNTGTNGETVRVGAGLSVNPSTNTLTVANVQHSTIKALDGTSSITISNGTGAVSVGADLTVGGNLYVNGNTTQVNTSELQVYDRTITLGIQSGTTASTTTWDLGVLMNYGDAGVAKTAGVIWESTNKRFQFSANSDNLSGISTQTPQITVATFAPIEVGELWINNTCTGGASQVIACSGTSLVLQNITVDAGTF